MHPMGEVQRHFWLTLGVAKACGVDLSLAMREGVLSPEAYAATITACRNCTDPTACEHWLEQVDAVAVPPEFCENAELLRELQAL